MKPFVTIITITWQAEIGLRKTLESILCQTDRDLECLLVDGGSTDGTLALIQEYQNVFMEKKILFRWISEPDQGIYDAMNKGLRMAEGEFVWFVNAGDTIAEPDTLKQLRQTLPTSNSENNAPDFIYGETMIVDEQGQVLGARRLKAPEKLSWKSFRMGMLVCHQSMLVKGSLAPEFDRQYHFSADFDWTIRCLRQAKSIHNTRLVLSHFLDGGVSKKKMKASLKERFKIMSKNYGCLPTVLRHVWFVCRATWFKILHGWI